MLFALYYKKITNKGIFEDLFKTYSRLIILFFLKRTYMLVNFMNFTSIEAKEH